MAILTGYIAFSRKCLTLLATDKWMFGIFVVMSVLGALTEGMSISLLVPILQSQGNPSGFENIPLLGAVAAQFDGYSTSERIKIMALIMAGVLTVRGVIMYIVDVLGLLVPLNLERQITVNNYKLMMQVRIPYLTDSDYGDLHNDISGWAGQVSILLTNVAVCFWNTLCLLVYGVMMLLVSWRLSVLVLIFMMIMVVALRIVTYGPLRTAGERWNSAKARLNQITMESVAGMKLIRLRAAEAIMIKKFSHLLDQVIESQRRTGRFTAITSPAMGTCAGLFICFLLFVSAIAHEGDSHAWVESLLIFLFLLFRLLGPVTQINDARGRIANLMPALEGLERFRRLAQEQRQLTGTQVIERLRRDVVLENVSFAYKSDGRLILDAVSATIEHGRMTAIVGPSGAGKSTLIGLITRLYDPLAGRILVEGHDLRDLDIQSWRRRLAVVSQDIFIFNDTVANNICFGLGDVPMDRIREAVKLAAADEFVDNLPDGYHTLLGDRGMRLSGGQQQRIAIARAILANPDLLIMDEATSHLDTFTEHAIQQALDQLSRNRTLLVIAHRLSTIRRADKVIVMKDGRIVEAGRHDALLKQRGIYWEMVEHQRLDLIDDDRAAAAEEAHGLDDPAA